MLMSPSREHRTASPSGMGRRHAPDRGSRVVTADRAHRRRTSTLLRDLLHRAVAQGARLWVKCSTVGRWNAGQAPNAARGRQPRRGAHRGGSRPQHVLLPRTRSASAMWRSRRPNGHRHARHRISGTPPRGSSAHERTSSAVHGLTGSPGSWPRSMVKAQRPPGPAGQLTDDEC